MRFENPFFVREMRQQRGERLWLCLGGLGLGLVLLALLLLGAIWFQHPDLHGRVQAPPASWVLLPHALFCYAAALFGGNSLFRAEWQRGTWESVRLLPYTPVEWLQRKLQFPAALVAAAWLCGLPYYLLLLGQGEGRPAETIAASLLPLLVGMLSLGRALGASGIGNTSGARTTDGAPAGSTQTLQTGLASIAALLSALMVVPAFIWFAPQLVVGRWFDLQVWGQQLPPWLALLLILVPSLGGSWSLGVAALTGSSMADRAAAKTAGRAIVVLVLFTLGMLPFPVAVRNLLLVLIACVGCVVWVNRRLSRRGLGERRAAEASGRGTVPTAASGPRKARNEAVAGLRRRLDYWAGRWDNPVFVRDLRLYPRVVPANAGCSIFFIVQAFLVMRVGLIRSWPEVEAAGNPIAAAGVLFHLLCPSLTMVGGIMLAGLVFGPTFASEALRARIKDRPGPDPDLLTPIPSAELLRGKILASVAFAWSRDVWAFPLIALGMVAALCDGQAALVAICMAGLPVAALWAASAEYGPLDSKAKSPTGLVDAVGPLGGLLIAAGELVVASGLLGLLGYPAAGIWLTALLCLVANAYFARWCWYNRIRRLDALRKGDLEPAPGSGR